ncbi:MAG TPA: two-component regulator propeller domain-containing protein [Cyclobacteriaceae bacterium]|nr:two-component regulator propeller domain-containing protein [Cyclobacteriaceae bacterium]
MMKKLKIIGLLLCVLVEGISQDFHYTLRNYTAVDGLPQSQVVGITEDKNGYLWMGTEGGGLARFDGREFKTYNTLDGLIESEIWGILIDKKENIWTLHPGGVTRFDGLHFTKFHSNPARNFYRIFSLEDTTFLISMDGRLSKIYNDSLHAPQSLVKGREVIRFYFSQKGDACYVLDDSSFVIQSANSISKIIPSVELGKIFSLSDYKNQILVQSQYGNYLVDPKTKTIQKANLGFDLTNRVYLYDEKRNIFWTHLGPNLIKESLINGVVKRDTILHDVTITQVFLDSENNTWFASSGNGLYKYFIQDFDRWSPDHVQGVMSVLKDNEGSVWMGTMTKGLWKINKGKVKSYFDKTSPSMPYRNSINSIVQDNAGNLWIGSKGGLGKYDKVKDNFNWIPTENGQEKYFVRCLKFDEDDGLWAVTGDGLCFYKNDKWVRKYTTKDGLTADYPMALYYSKNYKTLFLGNQSAIQTIKNQKVSTLKIKGIENTYVISMSSYQDSLIVAGTSGVGMVLFNPQTGRQSSISTREGLASDFIYFVAADEKDYLWVGTEKGINRIKLNAHYEIIENIHYGYENGLLGVETNQNSFHISPTEKYFGLVDGVYLFNDLRRADKSKNSFNLHLTDIEILYGEYEARDYADSVYGFFKIPHHLSLPTDKNHVTFNFNRVDKSHSKSIKFKYFLENFDKAWSQPTAMGQATYGNLPPGDYVFRVMATDRHGAWSTNQIAYAFTIQSPFYLQASFIIGALITLAGLVTLILYARVKQRIKKAVLMERIRAEEQESLRKEIARDFHDEMGNQLTRIINYVSLLKLNGQSGFNHSELYNKVEDSAKYLYSGTRDFIWAIDPVNDELSKLFIHIRDFGEKLFEEKGIQFRAYNDIKEKIKLPYGFSREANLIFKEAMTNAFKYSQANNVTLSLLRVQSDFQLVIEDDGVGFYAGNVEKMNGLKNIRERADRLNAILRISSIVQKGTKITLNFKLTKTLKYGLAL